MNAVDPRAVLARRRAKRQQWVDLPDEGKSVQISRPLQGAMSRFRTQEAVASAVEFVVDWRGFTEADLVGADLGSSDPVPFDPALWEDVVRDRLRYVGPIVAKLVEAISANLEAEAEAAKN